MFGFPNYSNPTAITSLPFTCPDNGMLLLLVGSDSSPGGRYFYVNDNYVGGFTFAKGQVCNVLFPVCKGDVLTSNASICGTYNFYPFR